MKTKEYRFDQYDSVYKYSVAISAYIFVGKLNGKTRKKFIADHQSHTQKGARHEIQYV